MSIEKALEWLETEVEWGQDRRMILIRDHILSLTREVNALKQANKALESLRPHWAKGYSSDSVAAQASTAALAQLWELLKADNQTTAYGRLKKLTSTGYETLPVFLVKDKEDGHVERVYGERNLAETFVNNTKTLVIDEWPVEFRKGG